MSTCQTSKSKYSRRGFTLVEMIFYAAFLGILSVLAINSTLLMTKAYTKLRVSRDLNSSATAVLERMTREIQGAYDFDSAQSTFGTNPGRLTLNTKNSVGADTTTEFYVENGIIKVREGGVSAGALMSSSSSVGSFIVRSLSSTNAKAIKIELTMTATRSSVFQTRNYYTTVILRMSY